MTDLNQALSDAIALAAEAHASQRDKTNEPYILHPLAVMTAVAPDKEAMIAAVLHDVIEDTSCDVPALARIGVPPHIIDAIVLLTRPGKEDPNRPTYKDYVRNLAKNELAVKVKLADLEHNMTPERYEGLPAKEKNIIKRYEWSKHYLLTGEE